MDSLRCFVEILKAVESLVDTLQKNQTGGCLLLILILLALTAIVVWGR